MPAPAAVDPRLLRAFVTVAEELHFTRAAARLYIAQQALSRDVRRLERELGCELFVRSTRRVTLTADGERLLPYARAVLQAQDDLLAAAGRSRPLLVDLNSPGLETHREVLRRARERAPGHELMARYESGLTWAAGELLAGRIDVSFGRFAGLAPALRTGLEQQPVRYEPMAVVLPEDHALAALPEVPLSALAGETVYAGAGNPAPWSGRTWRACCSTGGDHAGTARAVGGGEEEFQRIMARTRNPILAVVSFPPLPGTVSRPLVEPVPLSPVSLVWRKGMSHPALTELCRSAAEVAVERGWLRRPEDSWLPETDAAVMGAHPMSRC